MPIFNVRSVSFITRIFCIIFSFLILIGTQIPVLADKAPNNSIKLLPNNLVDIQQNTSVINATNIQLRTDATAQLLICIPLPGGGVVCF